MNIEGLNESAYQQQQMPGPSDSTLPTEPNVFSRPIRGIDTRPGCEDDLLQSRTSRSMPAVLPVPVSQNPFDEYDPHRGFLDWFPSSTDMFFRQSYLNLHLRLPSHYFSRVAMLFENAQLTHKDVDSMINFITERRGGIGRDLHPLSVQPIPNPLDKLEKSWDTLIGSLLREWETLNVASVLLLSAILTILQIDQAATYPITRYTAFTSLICALLSLLYGCLYIVRFGGMKRTSQSVRWASEWVKEAANTKVSILWNLWVMLALPATFLCWSIISFIICIVSFMWHSALQIPTDGKIVTIPINTARGLYPDNVYSVHRARIPLPDYQNIQEVGSKTYHLERRIRNGIWGAAMISCWWYPCCHLTMIPIGICCTIMAGKMYTRMKTRMLEET